ESSSAWCYTSVQHHADGCGLPRQALDGLAVLRPAQPVADEARRGGVDEVVEDVERDLLLLPEDHGRRDLEGGERHEGTAPDRREVHRRRALRAESELAEDRAGDAPAGAVAPVREVAETGLRPCILELRDA